MSAKIISIKLARKKYGSEKCDHNSIIINQELYVVECAECGLLLDPITFLLKIAQKENNLEWKIDKLQKKVNDLKDRVRTKCQHCGRITAI